jgi:hypothetical protein
MVRSHPYAAPLHGYYDSRSAHSPPCTKLELNADSKYVRSMKLLSEMKRLSLMPNSACYNIVLQTLETNGQHTEAITLYRQGVTSGVYTDFRGAREIDLWQFVKTGQPKGRPYYSQSHGDSETSVALKLSLPSESVVRVMLRDVFVKAPEKYAGYAGLGEANHLSKSVGPAKACGAQV